MSVHDLVIGSCRVLCFLLGVAYSGILIVKPDVLRKLYARLGELASYGWHTKDSSLRRLGVIPGLVFLFGLHSTVAELIAKGTLMPVLALVAMLLTGLAGASFAAFPAAGAKLIRLTIKGDLGGSSCSKVAVLFRIVGLVVSANSVLGIYWLINTLSRHEG